MCSKDVLVAGTQPSVRLREGSSIPAFPDSPVLKSFSALEPVFGCAGNGRGVSGAVALTVMGANGEHGLGYWYPAEGPNSEWGDPHFEYLVGRQLHLRPELQYVSYGPASVDRQGSKFFRAKIKGEGVSSTNDVVLIAEDDDFQGFLRAREGDQAPGMPEGALFSLLRDPIGCADSDIAFTARVRGGGVTSANDEGIWFNSLSPLKLSAREGDRPPGTLPGVRWKTFTSLAFPEDSLGPIFVASLVKGGSVSTSNDQGVWGTASSGVLRKLFREGDSIAGKILRSFKVLTNVPTSGTQTRSFNHVGKVVWHATFTNGATAIMETTVP